MTSTLRFAFRTNLLVAGAVLALTAALAAPTPARAATVPPGPPYGVATGTLAAALRCDGDLARSHATPVLLVPGTTLTAQVNFSWNYEKIFNAAGRPWCAITLPNHAMSDIQVAGAYVAYALRTMHARADGRKVSVVGFSQGGMVPRWTLKFWPDTRRMVEDLVGIDPSNHGTLDAVPLCTVGCAPALWQQRSGSNFLAALNRGQETYRGVDYTQMYTLTDEIVVPNLGPAASSSLHTGPAAISNIPVQSICPVHLADHLSMGTFDPIAYALVRDALTHAGTAQAARISHAVCRQAVTPGLNPVSVATHFARLTALAAYEVATYPHVGAEPPLKAYAQG